MSTVLAVHAHPDDESLWTGVALARAVELHHRVHVVTCTLGEEGASIGSAPAATEAVGDEHLGERRRRELRDAVAALGVTDHEVLGERSGSTYRDSGMPGSAAARHPRALVAAPIDEVAAAIQEVIERVRADVVLTYDEWGGQGHPDHIWVHDATTRAVRDSVRHPRLYAVVTPISWAREDRQWLGVHLDRGLGWRVPSVDEPYAPSVLPDDVVTHAVQATHLWGRQARALEAHASQVQVSGRAYALADRVAASLPGREGYVEIDPRTGTPMPPLGTEGVWSRLPSPIPGDVGSRAPWRLS